jgi:hypothetical protein
MFPMIGPGVESSLEAAALRTVIGGGAVVGPVVFAGVRFWASAEIDNAEVGRRRTEGVGALADPAAMGAHLGAGRGAAVRLLSCLVHEHDPRQSLRLASLLAGYAPRSILIDDSDDVLGVSIDAALLDQGVIVRRADGQLDVMATPGSRVARRGAGESHLDLREFALLETVYAAWLWLSATDAAADGTDANEADGGGAGLSRVDSTSDTVSVRASR